MLTRAEDFKYFLVGHLVLLKELQCHLGICKACFLSAKMALAVLQMFDGVKSRI